NIVCFRYRPATGGGDEPALEALNTEVLLRLQERGVAIPSSTRLAGRFALRVAHVNHRTTDEDIEALVDAVVAIGREVANAGR
ncbi:MAG: amino acid decarboxylase, partial [Gemmatimonas sp.]